MKIIDNFFVNALNNEVFSGASFGVSKHCSDGFQRVIRNYGFSDFLEPKRDVKNDSFFDLASLTKPLVTVMSLSHLKRNEKLNDNDTLSTFFEEVPNDKKNISVSQLMSHSSGLPAHREFFKKIIHMGEEKRKKNIIRLIFEEELVDKPGSTHVYSDLGFILLGYIVEKLSGMDLSDYWIENICCELGLADKFIFPKINNQRKKSFIKTGLCPWSNNALDGIVHDDNCRSLGGVAGHAGLFGTCEGVMLLCEEILLNIKLMKKEPINLGDWINRVGNSNWCLGFDLVSEYGSSSGKYFSKNSIGHLGFTGVSFWIDMEKEVIITLLTNRVLKEGDNRSIKIFRPKFHDLVMENMVG